MTPPSSTPMLPPPEATNPKMPIAFARSAGSVKRVIISESATAETTAPPTPCTARATTASPASRASPHASEASVKSAIPMQEQPAVPEEVTEPAPEQQEAAERQQVRVDDPRERGVGEAEVFLDRGQRDPDDRHVEHDHQVPRHKTSSASQRVRLSMVVTTSSLSQVFDLGYSDRHEQQNSSV